jgi:hypothetical protein
MQEQGQRQERVAERGPDKNRNEWTYLIQQEQRRKKNKKHLYYKASFVVIGLGDSKVANRHNYTAEQKLLHKWRACKSYDSPAKHVFLNIKPLLPATSLAAGNNGTT